MLVGIPLGVLSAMRQYSKLDFLLTGITFLGISIPSFLLGLGGLWILGVILKLVPIAGMSTPGRPTDFFDFLRHLFLPATILGFGYAALFMRYTRAAMLEVINTDYITTARSKGLPSRTVISRHAFRNALIPVITILALSLPEIVGAAVVTEQVFSWPGVGLLMVKAVGARDFYAIMGVALVLAVAVLVVQPPRRHRVRLRRPAHPVRLMATAEAAPLSAAARGSTHASTRNRRPGAHCVASSPSARDGGDSSSSSLMVSLPSSGTRQPPTTRTSGWGSPIGRPTGSSCSAPTRWAATCCRALLVGGRVSILVAWSSVAIATTIGTAVGVVGWLLRRAASTSC